MERGNLNNFSLGNIRRCGDGEIVYHLSTLLRMSCQFPFSLPLNPELIDIFPRELQVDITLSAVSPAIRIFVTTSWTYYHEAILLGLKGLTPGFRGVQS